MHLDKKKKEKKKKRERKKKTGCTRSVHYLTQQQHRVQRATCCHQCVTSSKFASLYIEKEPEGSEVTGNTHTQSNYKLIRMWQSRLKGIIKILKMPFGWKSLVTEWEQPSVTPSNKHKEAAALKAKTSELRNSDKRLRHQTRTRTSALTHILILKLTRMRPESCVGVTARNCWVFSFFFHL